MKKIKLTQGECAIVDDEDFEWLNQYKWHITSHNYAEATVNGKKTYMHRLINNTPKELITDHVNRYTLDNRRTNLRTANKSINSINRGNQSNNTSGYKGVSWDKFANKWAAYIFINKRKIHLGYFNEREKAIRVRKNAEGTYHAI